ncbi:MAG: twitching motility protein PilT [Candidatus Aminicenantes bacterium RBG_16_63_14]|nr:MAG: twitching motility protein PilT [Candidatus Aminicenantes bacterium RBG_16_63_14]OGD28605.1 MAG: twitching motility protein PilT [Candidatus Aminicenantes bacterium RBG_19FT_COMBO_65_30]
MRAILLDTNAYARFLAGDERVLNYLAQAGRVNMSAFVLGELFAGFRAGTREKQNRQVLDSFLAKPGVAVLDATRETAEYFGLIKTALKKSGQPIPLNDVWIAAHSLETGSILVTYDTHFAAVPGLRTWDELS